MSSFEETMEKSRTLDRLLTSAKDGATMPEVGGKSLAGGLRDMMAEVRKAADDVKTELRDEFRGMADDIRRNGKLAVQKVKAERAETNASFTDMLGNEVNLPEDEGATGAEGKPDEQKHE